MTISPKLIGLIIFTLDLDFKSKIKKNYKFKIFFLSLH